MSLSRQSIALLLTSTYQKHRVWITCKKCPCGCAHHCAHGGGLA